MVMGDVCGDFLRRRVVAKVWPPLVRTLESLASQSVLKDKFYRLVKCPDRHPELPADEYLGGHKS